MRMYHAYCSACDQTVGVVPISEFPEEVRPEGTSETALVCLAYGESCTGALCPLFELPTDRMRELYERTRGADGSAPQAGEPG